MQKNIYIKIILTIIAIELGVIVFQKREPAASFLQTVNEPSGVIQAKYDPSNTSRYQQAAETIKVEIVDINLKAYSLPYKYTLPVTLMSKKGSTNQLEAMETPIPVKNR
jgi:hypothetical protein